MKKLLSLFAVAATVWTFNMEAQAAGPLVTPAWVVENLSSEGLLVLDVRGDKATYEAGHIPGAVHTSYKDDGWRVKRGEVVGMLPDPVDLEKLIGSLGIGNDTHVVIVPAGANATEMGVGTRIYWTFKVLGHDKVSLLNGGMTAYEASGGPLESGAKTPQAMTFKANFRPELLATADDVRNALKSGNVALMDHRPTQHFTGAAKPPPVAKPGTLPGAANVAALDMTRNGGGEFMTPAAYSAMYKSTGADPQQETINFCNTGHWASVGWFVSHELLGNTKAKMYDGSMSEWSREPDATMVTVK